MHSDSTIRREMLRQLQLSLEANLRLADALKLTMVGVNISEAIAQLERVAAPPGIVPTADVEPEETAATPS